MRLPELLALAVFVAALLRWIKRGEWRRALLYLVVSCAIAVVIGALLLQNPAFPLEPGERYSWEGWYWILCISCGVLGALTLVVWIVLSLVRLVRRFAWRSARQV
jgi:H+/Cl- antiporter ClcA